MRIVHIWNIAATAYVLAKYQSRLGHAVEVVDMVYTSEKKLLYAGLDDPFYIISDNRTQFMDLIADKVELADIVHLHADDTIVNYIMNVCSKSVLVLTYHGEDIRGRWTEKRDRYKHADMVTVATSDLLAGAPNRVKHIPNPVDTEHFQRRHSYMPNTALFVMNRGYDASFKMAIDESRRRNLTTRVQTKQKTIFPYFVYPRFLELFEYYIDQKESRGNIIPAISLTGLQGLALGSKVIHFDRTYMGLPMENRADNVAKSWIALYEGLL
ncbi:MAG: hypothetical protein ACXADD_13815 [Candidatus Thorarchaeota archaeon]